MRVKSEDYLQHGSDIVALLVLEHQSQMHNLITRASFEARTAAHQDAGINEALNRPRDQASESTGRRIASVGEKLLRYMLLADEIELTDAVSSSSTFAQEFSARGPRDAKGRSLYELDLQKRLFRYPCSFLVYSESFDRLPDPVKIYLGKRLQAVLTAKTCDDEFAQLTLADRQAVAEILQSTKSEFWNRYVVQAE